MMTPERWQAIDELLQGALELNPAERTAFLEQRCAHDSALRREVEALLCFQPQAASFLEAPPSALAADLISAQPAFVAPRQIGAYEVLRELGHGGMGAVYLARDARLGRQVALKLLSPAAVAAAASVRRFQQEARAVSALNHPNILTLYELGETKNETDTATHFIVTEYVEGQTLRSVITQGGLTLGEALDVAVQTTSALAAAHQAGIVHRDIKPENLMLRPDGLVKVLDFGIAKLARRKTAAEALADFSTVKTNPGLIMGTVSYMSPEQARGLDVDARSDLFSLGVVLYEMLTGHTPFSGATRGDVLVAILDCEPPLLKRYVSALPAALQGIVNRAIAKDCAQRYQRASELLTDLKELEEELKLGGRLKRAGDTPAREVSLSLRVGQTVTDAPGSGTDGAPATAINPSARSPRRRVYGWTRQPLWLGRGLVIAALLFFAALAVHYTWLRKRDGNAEINSIAVLPFANVGNDPQLEYLPDGLTEDLINNLAQLPGLQRVMARSTVFTYKGREVDPRQAGRDLKVQAVVTGRVQRQGERLAVHVTLIDTSTGAQLWGETYERHLADVLTIQTEITREIVLRLRQRLDPASQQQLARRQPADSKAYELYARGHYLYLQYTRPDLNKALDYFRQAIALDARYALAWCGIADVYAEIAGQYLPPSATIPQARAAALQAIALDETLPEAHHSLARVKLWGDWDWAGAEREYQRALQLNPNFALAHIYYSEFLTQQQRFEEALREIRRAEEADPVSLQARVREGRIYMLMRQYERAMELFRQMLELNPQLERSRIYLGLTLSLQGRHKEAVAQMRLLQTPSASAAQLVWVAYVYARAGQRGEALSLLNDLQARASRGYLPPTYFAYVMLGLGEYKEMFEWLHKGYEEQSDHLLKIHADPIFDPVRDDPRFSELLRRIGLAQ